jgi:hypothetical protein
MMDEVQKPTSPEYFRKVRDSKNAASDEEYNMHSGYVVTHSMILSRNYISC